MRACVLLCLVAVALIPGCRNSPPGSPTASGEAPAETARAKDALPPAPPASKTDAEPSLEELGAEFRRLRAVRGHLSGGAGNWNDDVDRWGGRKHKVMGVLKQRLGVMGTPKARLIEIMGEPDETGTPGQSDWSYLVRPIPPEVSEILVYFWRGWHDFLYFFVRDGRVLGVGWWMAGE